ncbi:MAG: universal stress protein [Bacteroidia bacterium]|nr:universal stress protein [Bacteroidia bacterium]
MKTILVPTDFSDIATNAINYAARLAIYTKSKLFLFHAYHVPMIVSEVPFVLTSEENQLEEQSNEQMKLIIDDLQKKYENRLEIESLSMPGFTSDEIVDIAKDRKCDLIVMGTKGAGGSSRFLGTNTVDVIKETHCNVLVVPEKVKFQKIDKIVFAFDYKAIKNSSVFDPIIELASLFNSEIMIFNIEDSRVKPTTEKATEGIKLEHAFENLKHTYWFSEHENIVEAINEFAIDNHAVMITMIKRSHNLIQQILSKSNTKLMALYSQLPLLVLHEQTDK